jgi:hypothetical protein
LRPPFAPMEALSVDEIPTGSGWQYEPKWDGFRCLVFRNGGKVDLQSKSGRSLTRYFPELVEAILNVQARNFAIDGEIVVPHNGTFSFDDLLQRIHPAQSRVKRLAAETPALLIVFDLLADSDGQSLTNLPLRERRRKLEAFARRYLRNKTRIRLSPATTRLSCGGRNGCSAPRAQPDSRGPAGSDTAKEAGCEEKEASGGSGPFSSGGPHGRSSAYVCACACPYLGALNPDGNGTIRDQPSLAVEVTQGITDGTRL